MAGPGDEIAAGGCGHLRASHADREQVIGTLKAAFVQGRLAKHEFDLRVGQAFASRTYAELAALTADLPAGLARAMPSQPARARGGRPVLWPGRWIMVATAGYAGVWGYLLFPSPRGGEGMLIIDSFQLYVLVLMIAVWRMVDLRREKRSGGQRPPRPAPGVGGHASRRLPPAGPGGQLPPVDPGPRPTAEAARRRLPRPPLPVRGHCAGGALTAGTAPASG